MPSTKVAIQVRWNKPVVGWFKLNTNGASFGNPGKAGVEAISEIAMVIGSKGFLDQYGILLVL